MQHTTPPVGLDMQHTRPPVGLYMQPAAAPDQQRGQASAHFSLLGFLFSLIVSIVVHT
jgi:hypothetical protein